jgi:thiamine-phosphate pyrophosphorylase
LPSSTPIPRLYAILDAALVSGVEEKTAATLAEAGVQLIEYRNKKATSRTFFDISNAICARLSRYAVRFIVNDRPDIAFLVGAGGVHVGQDDLPVAEARLVCGPERWVGLSTHNLEQVRAAEETTADYVAFGPVFATPTKERADPVVGIETLRQARRLTTKPLVAIGGITLDRAKEVYAAGADSLAVIRDLAVGSNPGARALEYLALARDVFPT